MKVTDHFDGKGTRISFELLPPLRGSSIESVYRTIDQLKDFNPSCINITYHKEETVFSRLADGSVEKKVLRKGPGQWA
jgi:methylenetetrahydrofolate reductase (NADPH)